MSRLRFKLHGSGHDLGDAVTLRDFGDFVDAPLDCFRQLERESDLQARIEYRITGLEVGSAGLEVDALSPGDLDRSAESLARDFEIGFHALEDGNILRASFERRTQEAFVGLLKSLRHNVRRIEFEGSRSYRLGRQDAGQTISEKRRSASVLDSVSGKIEAMNIHSEPARFYLYPVSGPARVRCIFNPAVLMEDVRTAINRHTTVHGLLDYESGEPFAVEVVVDRVEVHPPDDQLPTLASLFGSAPDFTGGVGCVAFVRELRDAED